MSARTATQAMAVTRLDGEVDEHGNEDDEEDEP